MRRVTSVPAGVTGLALATSSRGITGKNHRSIGAAPCIHTSSLLGMLNCETNVSKAILGVMLFVLAIGGTILTTRYSKLQSVPSHRENTTSWTVTQLLEASYGPRLHKTHSVIGRGESIVVTKDLASLEDYKQKWRRGGAAFTSAEQKVLRQTIKSPASGFWPFHGKSDEAFLARIHADIVMNIEAGPRSTANSCSRMDPAINATALLDKYHSALQEILLAIICQKQLAMIQLDDEAQFLRGEPFSAQYGAGGMEPLQPQMSTYQLLQRDVEEVMMFKDPGFVFMLPVSPCARGVDDTQHPGNGLDSSNLQMLLGKVSQKAPITYYSLWTFKRNAIQAITHLHSSQGSKADRLADRKILVVVFEDRWHEKVLPSAQVGMALPSSTIASWRQHRSSVIKNAVRLAQQQQHSVFLFDVGALGPIIIHSMYRANPSNIYLDMQGSLYPAASAQEGSQASGCAEATFIRRGIDLIPVQFGS